MFIIGTYEEFAGDGDDGGERDEGERGAFEKDGQGERGDEWAAWVEFYFVETGE